MTGAQRIVVADASVIINLIHAGLLSLLGAVVGFRFTMPEEVYREITYPGQADAVDTAVRQGWLDRFEITDPAEQTRLVEFRQVMGLGEAACLACAELRGWLVASDERGRFLRIANDRLGRGRVLNTPGLLLEAIHQGHLTVERADQAKTDLEQHRFRMKFGSFAELLGGGRGED